MNGNETGRTTQNAREMTAEIDRITEAEVEKLAQHAKRDMDRAQASSLGGHVLTYNPDSVRQGSESILGSNLTQQMYEASQYSNSSRQQAEFINDGDPIRRESEIIRSNDQIRQIAEVEEGYEEAAKYNTGIAGAETAVQAQERLAEDREDIDNETGANGIYVKKLMDRNNKRITAETVSAVDRIISDKSYHPGELDETANKARIDFLQKVFNRPFGGRN